jgi:hypothetical protein
MLDHVRATAGATMRFQLTPVTFSRMVRPVDSVAFPVRFPGVTAAPHGCGAVSVLNVDVAGANQPVICANAGL